MLRNTLQLNFVLGLGEPPCKVQLCNVEKPKLTKDQNHIIINTKIFQNLRIILKTKMLPGFPTISIIHPSKQLPKVHFLFKECVSYLNLVSLDSGRSQCEANEKCGLAAETRGEYGQSREFLIDARKISRGRTNWKHDNGITWHQQVKLSDLMIEIIIFYRIQCIWLEF